MKKLIKITLIFCVSLFSTSCSGLSSHLTNNLNLQQTNVVLSEANYHIVKHVDTEVTAKYIFGFGGYKSHVLHQNAVAELTKKAELEGSQALINVTVKHTLKQILFYSEITLHAEGTVIEFDK